MDKLWAILPFALCIGMHFFMMRGHGGHVKDSDKNLGYDGGMYTCPMHPEVKKDKPGSCPKCGMTLVKTK
jgi:hypothetical protein